MKKHMSTERPYKSSSDSKKLHLNESKEVLDGVMIKDEDIKAAFEFFDAKNSGQITASTFKERLEALTKKMTRQEMKSIFDGKDYITIHDVKELLQGNNLSIDPYKEAFSILDPTLSGYISEERLMKIFSSFGFGDLSDEEIQLLITTGDADRDGKIGLSDFRLLGITHDQGDPEHISEGKAMTERSKSEEA
jgi:Ca2+-binding EF-hand superfamily protein